MCKRQERNKGIHRNINYKKRNQKYIYQNSASMVNFCISVGEARKRPWPRLLKQNVFAILQHPHRVSVSPQQDGTKHTTTPSNRGHRGSAGEGSITQSITKSKLIASARLFVWLYSIIFIINLNFFFFTTIYFSDGRYHIISRNIILLYYNSVRVPWYGVNIFTQVIYSFECPVDNLKRINICECKTSHLIPNSSELKSIG